MTKSILGLNYNSRMLLETRNSELILQPARRNRIKKLINELNRQRKTQDKKIDLLCNDLISTQKKIVQQLQEFNFTIDFCHAIAGQIELPKLLSQAQSMFNSYYPDCGLGVYLLKSNAFEFHLTTEDQNRDFDISRIESCFDDALVTKICQSNAVCSTDDMFAMSFNSDLSILNKLNLCTIPLSGFAPAVGFILIWQKADQEITASHVHNLRSIAPVFARAIRGCMSLPQANEVFKT